MTEPDTVPALHSNLALTMWRSLSISISDDAGAKNAFRNVLKACMATVGGRLHNAPGISDTQHEDAWRFVSDCFRVYDALLAEGQPDRKEAVALQIWLMRLVHESLELLVWRELPVERAAAMFSELRRRTYTPPMT